MNLLITASRYLQDTYRLYKNPEIIVHHAKIYRAVTFLYSLAPDILTEVNTLNSLSKYRVIEK
jgi:hypothetical protein